MEFICSVLVLIRYLFSDKSSLVMNNIQGFKTFLLDKTGSNFLKGLNNSGIIVHSQLHANSG